MKKVINYFLSFLMMISLIVPFIPLKVYAMETSFTYAYINETELSVRQCPSTDTSVCPRLKDCDGDTIWLWRPRAVEVIGKEGDWSKIRFNYWGYTYEGYVYTYYLDQYETYTLDQNYGNQLRAKGFPESYIEKLLKMHAKHPSWNFEVSNTGVSLEDAVNGEIIPISKNLISTRDLNQLSTDPAAYSNGYYVQFEPGWYAPSRDALRYYLDPRNFLDDNSIFMFEQLSYNESQNENVVQNILNGSFLAGNYSYNGETKTYASTFVEAGKKYGVSPVHLAARVLQEQGKSGSMTASMDGGDGKTYYNYFNFGASGNSTDAIYNGALNYAKRSGWDSPYASIMGATSEISDGYITNNQDTLYYEKFNIIGSSRYWHQYMANVQAPYSEGYTTYRSYWDAHISDLSFTFKIPVYTDMGSGTVLPTQSSNNNLKSLSITNTSLVPGFDSSITEYKAYVTSNITKVNIKAEVADSKAKVTGTGDINISANTTNASVKVTAEDGSVKEYKITIIKTESGKDTPKEIANSIGLTVKDNNISGFSIGRDISDYVNMIKTNFNTSEVKVYDSYKEITSGIVKTGLKFKIKNNGEEATYTVILYGDTNCDGKISAQDFAKVKSHLLGATKLSGDSIYSADTNKDGKISAQDFAKIKSHLLGASKLQQ